MLIDDEPIMLAIIGEELRNKGYEVETYGSAYKCVASHHGKCPCSNCPDVILTDFEMPQMNGVEYLNLLNRRKCPCRHIALMTGDTLDDARFHKIKKRGVKLFRKPFSITDIIGWVSLIQKT